MEAGRKLINVKYSFYNFKVPHRNRSLTLRSLNQKNRLRT